MRVIKLFRLAKGFWILFFVAVLFVIIHQYTYSNVPLFTQYLIKILIDDPRVIIGTASVNHVAFNKAVPVGSVVTIESKVSRAFKSSMEIYVDVWIEDRETGERTKVNEGIYTFVAVDRTGSPVKVPEIVPETELEKERFDGALRRKQLSLLLANKIEPSQASELKALFR